MPVSELTHNGKEIPVVSAREASERDQILQVLKASRGRVGGLDGAAARLGLKRTTLISRMKKLEIDPRQVS